MRPPCRLTLAIIALFAMIAAAGCGAGGGAGGGAGDAVASTSVIADIAQQVAGDRFQVRSLIPRGADPHAFDPVPSDLRVVAGADVVLVNGAGLEGGLLDTLKAVVGDVPVVSVSSGLDSRTPQPGEPELAPGETDPHFWLDPELVKTYVGNIAAAFTQADPDGGDVYAANATAFKAQLDELDAWIRRQVRRVRPADRQLVTDHLSYGYYADRYGFTVVGTVIPSATTGESPTARQLSELTATIRRTGAKAIFVEAGANPKLAEQIGAEAGVRVVTDLLDHSVTAADGPAPNYVAMMKHDTLVIVDALR